MSANPEPGPEPNRRSFLRQGAVGLTGLAVGASAALAAGQEKASGGKEASADKGKPTKFQVACMTLPYAQFPLKRALSGLKAAGYQYVAWGTSHKEADGKQAPVMPADASPDQAKELGKRCRDLGLEPLMMFSGVYPEAKDHLDVLKNRIRQAAAASVPQVLTFGNTKGGDRKLWVEHFKALGPIARDQGVVVVIKQHGGLTARGVQTLEIIRDVADEGVKINYDAGNVMDYLHLEPAAVLADFTKCASEVRSFCIKDHRHFPKDQDCGPGLGEIDHYRLLAPVAFTGRALPLCCENISAPAVPRPTTPEGIDALARRAREFLELVIQGIQT
jgi:sugar phosphate isomerase/epimerase